MKILVVDDEYEICDLLELAIELEMDAQVLKAYDGQEAIDVLEKNPDIELCICDYYMPKRNGDSVQEYIINHKLETKFVLCSAYYGDSNTKLELDQVFQFIKKPDIYEGVSRIFKTLKEDERELSSRRSYMPISMDLLHKIGICPADIYLKMSDDKVVKVINEGEAFNDIDYQKYKGKKVEKLYIEIHNGKLVLQNLEENLKVLFARNNDTKDKIKQTVDVQKIVQSAVKEFGFTEEVYKVTKVGIDFAYSIINKNDKLEEAFKVIFKDNEAFVPTHSIALSFISCGIASQMKWNSDLTMCKLCISSFLHDLYLGDINTKEYELSGKEATEPEFRNHPLEISNRIKTIDGIPPDVDRILMDHHELLNGFGFPKGLLYNQISPLSALFITSHRISELIYQGLFNGKPSKKEDILKELAENSFNKGPFEEVFNAYKNLKLFG